jgi:hypothetical protein
LSNTPHLTTGQLANLLGVPGWRVRRAVDSLNPHVPRAGLYRLIPRAMIGAIQAELLRLDNEKAAATPAGGVRAS